MIQECNNLEYLLDLDFEYGSIIIDEIFRQKDEKELSDVYYFYNSYGVSAKYKTFDDFKKSLTTQKPASGRVENLTYDEIMEKTKRTLDLFT